MVRRQSPGRQDKAAYMGKQGEAAGELPLHSRSSSGPSERRPLAFLSFTYEFKCPFSLPFVFLILDKYKKTLSLCF